MVFLNVSESGESIFDTPEVWGGHRSHFRRPSKVRKIVTLCHALSRVKSGPPRYVRTFIRTCVRTCTRRPRCRWGLRMDPFLHELSFGPIDEVDVLAELRRFTGVSGSGCTFQNIGFIVNFGFMATFGCPYAPRRLTCYMYSGAKLLCFQYR